MNNFNILRSLLHFKDVGDFYFLQIFKRKKDNPDLNKHEKLIKSYSIFSLEEYDALQEHIISACIENNARAYLRLNKRNSAHVALSMIKYLATAIESNQTNSLFKAYDSIVGQYHSDKDKTWLVDIDVKDVALVDEISIFINELNGYAGNDTLCRACIPTMAGFHIISRPFNMKLFSEKYPDITVHKDNPTLLYFKNETI